MTTNFLGTLFLIVGNSGSGKDSIISGVIKERSSNLKQVYAPKRYITRPPSEFERNNSVTIKEFKNLEEKGEFALSWHIYELDYGIPKDIEEWLEKGHPVIVNVSRTVIEVARKKYKNTKVVFIEVPFEITLQRIRDRKRESVELLNRRIERARKNQKLSTADFSVNNSEELDDAISQLLEYIKKTMKQNGNIL
jgi:ribose 1,5-bisphosphokinase